MVANGYFNGFGSLFNMTAIACQFPALHRAERATLIRKASRQEVATDSCEPQW